MSTAFPSASPGFLSELAAHNDKAWFEAHRADYLTLYKSPAERIAAELEAALAELTGGPVKSKVFRIHRDVRFSKDKRPYNAWIRMSFMPGPAAGWYLGLDPDALTLGAGGFDQEGPALDALRRDIADPKGRLAPIVGGLLAEGFRLWEPALKRVPAPWPQDHPRGDLLKHKGLTLWRDLHDPALIHGEDAPGEWLAIFERLAPLVRALAEVAG